MEQILKEIIRQHGIEFLRNGADLAEAFTALSQTREDTQLFCDFVDTRSHTALLGAGNLSAKQQAECYEKTVTKLSNAVQIPREKADQVCTAFWHAVHNSLTPPERQNAQQQEREKQKEEKLLARKKKEEQKLLARKRQQEENELIQHRFEEVKQLNRHPPRQKAANRQPSRPTAAPKTASKPHTTVSRSVQQRRFLLLGWLCLLVHIAAIFLRDYFNFFYLQNYDTFSYLQIPDVGISWNFDAVDCALLAILLLTQFRVYAWGFEIRSGPVKTLISILNVLAFLPLVVIMLTSFVSPIIFYGNIVDGHDLFTTLSDTSQLLMAGLYAFYHLRWMSRI